MHEEESTTAWGSRFFPMQVREIMLPDCLGNAGRDHASCRALAEKRPGPGAPLHLSLAAY